MKSFIVIAIILTLLLTITGCSLPAFSLQPQTSATPVATTPVVQTSTTVAEKATPTPESSIQPTTQLPISPTFATQTGAVSNSTNGLSDFVSVIAKVKPSVVAINTKVPAIDFFGSTYTQEGAGSGWIIDASGLIVTNNHVVAGANSITVTLEDGRNFSASNVRTDSVNDLAILKIDTPKPLPALTIGDSSKLQVGEWVIAIGNSLGQGISATKGIVSALGVTVSADQGETLYDLIQTDAAINPGNSGGPLVDLHGDVVGINSIKVAQVGVEGMGYAISSQVAVPIINELVTQGFVTRPWLGVRLYAVNETVVLRYNLAVNTGILVTEVVSGAPADIAGIKAGDVITNFAGTDVITLDDLTKAIRAHKIGETVSITYWRGNRQNNVDITLAQSPAPTP